VKAGLQVGLWGWRICPVYHQTLPSDTEPSSFAEGHCSDSQWTGSLDTWRKYGPKTSIYISIIIVRLIKTLKMSFRFETEGLKVQ